jgi:phage/plasmid-like protein (TIGR03299 family)
VSKETHEWLSNNTLIGFTDKRGHAWHYRQGDENHYTGAVPVEDVQKRLFDWTADEAPLFVPSGTGEMVQVVGRKAIVHSGTNHVMGIFKDGYQPHQYNEWLVKSVGNILDDELSIGSAGILKGGAVAWVSVEVPENITTPEGVVFRPNLLATTSFDGSVATTYKPIVTNVVCDNTMTMALSEAGPTFKVKHSRNSLLKLNDAREALGIVHTINDEFAREVAMLCDQVVTDTEFERFVDMYTPMPETKEGASTRGATMAENKREALWNLWNHDDRVKPWNGSAFGIWQAVNTYNHHVAIVRNAERAERNMLNAVEGKTETMDREVVAKIMELVA